MRHAQQLGRYHLLNRVAFGGMAEIYRARTFDAHGEEHFVAVKRVLSHLAEDRAFMQMLIDEARITGMVKHPNIAALYEFARAGQEYFLAMEFVDGKDLRAILERSRMQQRPMPPEHAAFIAAEIAGGLHAAHTALGRDGKPLRIVHRDVSPSNVICAYNGDVKLCDFGIAKATLSKVTTRTGVIKGKVKYMSPEQALGRKLDHRTDIFSLGVCLYEMLTKTPPFIASTEMDMLLKVRDAKYKAISDIVPSVPPEIEAIVDRMLTKSRARRYQSAEEVVLALQGFLKRYSPRYAPVHLGRYLRQQFSTEIADERELLDDYIVPEHIADDVGENLIANELGPDATYTLFTPRPLTLAQATGSADSDHPPQRHDLNSLQAQSEFDIHNQDTLILPGRVRASLNAAESDPNPPNDIHEIETLIIDHDRNG